MRQPGLAHLPAEFLERTHSVMYASGQPFIYPLFGAGVSVERSDEKLYFSGTYGPRVQDEHSDQSSEN